MPCSRGSSTLWPLSCSKLVSTPMRTGAASPWLPLRDDGQACTVHATWARPAPDRAFFITAVETCGWWLLAARVFHHRHKKRTRTWATTVVTMFELSRHQAAAE